MVTKTQIEELYKKFFIDNEIDIITWILNGKRVRFATYPFIWKKYWEKAKILFVWLDIWKDERCVDDIYQKLDDRYCGIMKKGSSLKSPKDYNPHISWTYITSMYYLFKEKLSNDIMNMTFKKWIKELIKNDDTKNDNPLEYVSLINYYKFVTIWRCSRQWSSDRKNQLSNNKENELFLKEIEILNPDIIIFQTIDKNLGWVKAKLREDWFKNVITLNHPSFIPKKLDKKTIINYLSNK
jgi:hypothetical protein